MRRNRYSANAFLPKANPRQDYKHYCEACGSLLLSTNAVSGLSFAQGYCPGCKCTRRGKWAQEGGERP